jgi:hypothetical protein
LKNLPQGQSPAKWYPLAVFSTLRIFSIFWLKAGSSTKAGNTTMSTLYKGSWTRESGLPSRVGERLDTGEPAGLLRATIAYAAKDPELKAVLMEEIARL